MQHQCRRRSIFLPYSICILAALFYLYEFILQVSPSVMTQELMQDFSLNAAGLGVVSAFYFYAYAPMQLPAGLLYDRYGPRVLLTIAILICAAGALFFGLAKTAEMASLGRVFMGIGSAFSFIGALVLVSRWFPPQYFAFLAGLVQFMSSVGAITAEVPLAKAIEYIGWRNALLDLAVIGVLLAIAVWLVVRDRPESGDDTLAKSAPLPMPFKQSLKEVCGRSQTWMIGFYGFLCWAPIMGFAALWGVPYLSALYGISATKAAEACAMIWLGIGIGSPLIGWWSEYIRRRCLPLFIAAVTGLVSLSIILYVPGISFHILLILLFCFGLAASGQSLSFALVADTNRPEVVGTGIGFQNMAVVAGGAIFQPLLGWFLQLGWDGHSVAGAPVYAVNNYRVAMLVLPLCYLIACVITLKGIRETYCKS
jgi:MFS family permease